ncbi:MAG: hypothetical protein ACRD4O_01395 [Bryobacteraceae bacterium]
MKATTIVVQTLIRLVWLTLIVLGSLFWSGSALALVGIHMDLGVIFVLLLWVIAALALYARAGLGLGVIAIVWGLVVAGYGMAMPQMLAGGNAWPIGVGHLLIGIIGIGFAEMLGARIKRRIRGAVPAAL